LNGWQLSNTRGALCETGSRRFFDKMVQCHQPLCTFKQKTMLLTTTPTIEGKPIQQYIGIVTAEAIIGANIFKDLFAGIRDIVGGRSGTYERVIEEARQNALVELQQKAQQLGADAVVGIDLDFETVGSGGSMLMVVATGTAVKL
jgi:uncharacterized protein YbjQ (UPF0145 family)